MSESAQGQVTVFAPTRANRKCMHWLAGLFGGGGGVVALCLLLTSHWNQGSFIAACFLGALCLLPIFLAVHSLSVRVEIGPSEVFYRSVLGQRRLQLREVKSALITSYKGCHVLAIRGGRRWISCSNYSFSNEELTDIQQLIVARCKDLSVPIQGKSPDLSEAAMIKLAVTYLLTILVVLTAIVVLGIHHIHTRAHP